MSKLDATGRDALHHDGPNNQDQPALCRVPHVPHEKDPGAASRNYPPGSVQAEIVAGLTSPQARLPTKLLYDDLGCQLFEAITYLPEYYPTRTERALFEQHGAAIAQAIGGPGGALAELGCGSCRKAERLFEVFKPRSYLAIDIAQDYLATVYHRLPIERKAEA